MKLESTWRIYRIRYGQTWRGVLIGGHTFMGWN